eukprot:291920-Pelagomonas_calceolata.AAC.1
MGKDRLCLRSLAVCSGEHAAKSFNVHWPTRIGKDQAAFNWKSKKKRRGEVHCHICLQGAAQRKH